MQVVTKETSTLSLDDLLTTAKSTLPKVDVELIKRAYLFAENAHAGQDRKTGEPYIQHPLHVAHTIAQYGLGDTAIVAALLHDVREDTRPEFHDRIVPEFGEAVNFIVEGVTKLSRVRKLRNDQGNAEDLRNIFFAMSRDIRVIIIKLADRLHNLRTLHGHDAAKQREVARQTLDVYAPIADRLGMGVIKGELADLAFEYLYPQEAVRLRTQAQSAFKERNTYCNDFCERLAQELTKNGLEVVNVHGRAKRLYSLYTKLQRHNNDISQIYDLVAVRAVLPTTEDCYRALGIIHRRWRPLVGKIKDYCATPKANGYQSIHTTVITKRGSYVEIQLRTPQMHEQAERGVAAAWVYQDSKRKKPSERASLDAAPHDVPWVRQLADWQRNVDNPEEFFQTLRTDFFKNRIFCLTPEGEIMNLPEHATPVDFAYAVHTDVGNRAIGAQVNGKAQALDFQLGSGDLVSITLGPRTQAPQRSWLDFAKTSDARKGIKQWYKKLGRTRAINIGSDLLEREMVKLVDKHIDQLRERDCKEYLAQNNYKNLDDLKAAVGRGERNPRQVIKRMFTEELFGTTLAWPRRRLALNVKLNGHERLQLKRAHCCRPIEGDAIVAIKTGMRTAVIHRDECSLVHAEKSILEATWLLDSARTYRIWIHITAQSYVGMLRDVADICAQAHVAIHDVSVRPRGEELSSMSLLVEVTNTEKLAELMRKLESIPQIKRVRRGRT